MTILISDAFDATLPEKLKKFGEVTDDKSRAKDADIILVRSKTICNKEYIDKLEKCRLIIRGGVGTDNIDSVYAKSKGIDVKNTPKSSAIAVAELAFALMINVPNHIVAYDNGMKNGQWLKELKRTELYGKNLTLFGYGNIARKVAERAKAFGMNVSAYDKYCNATNDSTHLVSTLEEAVENADYISIHMPLTEETRNMFCKKLFANMKHKPVVINTARGAIVNAEDMKEALESGVISWYCADVYPTDPPSPDYVLLKAANTTLTPHAGATSKENQLRIGNEIVDILTDYLK